MTGGAVKWLTRGLLLCLVIALIAVLAVIARNIVPGQSSPQINTKLKARTAENLLAMASDLSLDARLAKEQAIPILVAVTRNDCSYCQTLKQEILLPMLRSGDYRGAVIMREVNIDTATKIINFDFDHLSAQSWAQQYKVTFTPTVLLLNFSGEEVAKRLVGINTVSMYGWYLDEAIVGATETIRAQLK